MNEFQLIEKDFAIGYQAGLRSGLRYGIQSGRNIAGWNQVLKALLPPRPAYPELTVPNMPYSLWGISMLARSAGFFAGIARGVTKR